MRKFKIGDTVRCVESEAAVKIHALGYKPGQEFVVDFISKYMGGNICFPKDGHGMFECDLVLVKQLPKSFACRNTNQKLWDKYISWFNTTSSKNICGDSDVFPYYGITANGVYDCHKSIDYYDTILTLKEWDEIVNGTQTKTEETMKNYTITREQLQKIYDVACSGWKETIIKYSRRNPFGNTIEFTQEEVVAMFVASSLSQRTVLEGIFGKQTNEIDLSTGKVGDKVLFSVNRDLNHALMCVRTYGDYENKAFVLNDDFNWEILKDMYGQLCLVPTRK